MNKKICFYVDESPYHLGKYLVKPKHENFHLEQTSGSYNVICARLMNLSYAQFLRFCRDVLDAEIYGKKNLYPVAYFSDKKMAEQLCKLLNARANMVLWETENGELFLKKKQYVEDLEKHRKLLRYKHYARIKKEY